MAFTKTGIKAVLFDYGNTLTEFGPAQMRNQCVALADTLSNIFGNCDYGKLKAIRHRQAVAPFSNGYRENDLRSICAELVFSLYKIVPNERCINALIRTRYDFFIRNLTITEDIAQLLGKIREKYKIGLISNYPCSRSILKTLSESGLSDLFDTVVISGDVGYVKPHPKPFETALSCLKLQPADCLFVGDNWLADIQGAKRMGMKAILTSQYLPHENFEPSPKDHIPDAEIHHINELESWLLN